MLVEPSQVLPQNSYRAFRKGPLENGSYQLSVIFLEKVVRRALLPWIADPAIHSG